MYNNSSHAGVKNKVRHGKLEILRYEEQMQEVWFGE